MNSKERFLTALQCGEVDRPPVWLMRQAGRYLPEYRALKEGRTTREMMRTPELAAAITAQPVRLIGVDAAILYSDILMIPDAMGMGLDFAEGEGPVFQFAVDGAESLARLDTDGVTDRLSCVFEAVRQTLKLLPRDFPLIGFAGAPFTVACYMIAGKAEEGFLAAKRLAWDQPDVFHGLLDALSAATIDYLVLQADAGVCAVQLFDTWAGLLSPQDYVELAKPYSRRVLQVLRDTGIPAIHFARGSAGLLEDLADLPANAIGVDWQTDLKTVRARLGHTKAVQGNFDPDLLFASPEIITARVRDMLRSAGNPRRGYIANLGHGVNRLTKVSSVRCFVEAVKAG